MVKQYDNSYYYDRYHYRRKVFLHILLTDYFNRIGIAFRILGILEIFERRVVFSLFKHCVSETDKSVFEICVLARELRPQSVRLLVFSVILAGDSLKDKLAV